MELRTLRYFIGVLEAGSITRAAGALYISQPALTAQIKKLEDELNVQLFERSSAGVTATQAGLQLYEDARRLLSDAEGLRDRIRRLPKGPEGSVTVALPFMLASLLMGPILARLKLTHPRIRVFVLDDLSPVVTKAILDHRADMGLLIDAPAVDGLDGRALARDNMYFFGRDQNGDATRLIQTADSDSSSANGVSSPGSPTIAFEAAVSLPLLLQSRRFVIRRRVEEAAVELGVSLNIAHEHDSTRTIRSLLLCGAGFTFAPACSLRASPASEEDWVHARVVQPELALTYTLVTPTAKEPSAAAQVVMDTLIYEAHAMILDGSWGAQWLGDPTDTEIAA